ncbi:MAG: dephospho-CoA kinase [Oligoflexia bacterium]|nr:dephospho-CoA kinase [Oligoflexia bacterium]
MNLISNLSPEKRIHGCKIPVLGLTGGIASGKSTASDFLASKGFKVINADKLVKDIYETKEAKNFVSLVCPQAVSNDFIHFPTFREFVFNQEEMIERVENFIYQRMPERFLKECEGHPWVIYDVPLLFEKELDEKVDTILLIACSREEQKKRLMARDNSSGEMADKILDLQWPMDEKRKLAHHIIENDHSIEDLKKKLEDYLELDDYFIS